ncbi:MAG TPA: ankyrin repeat domain-containing protein [Bryobacteraceae bacterium]
MRRVYVVVGVFFFLFSTVGSAAVDTIADAAMKQDIALVRSLLKQKADVNQSQADGTTALHWAVRQDSLEMVELLIGAGANVKAANRFGVTPLSLACVNGNAAMIEALLKAGLDANAVLSELGETPLMMAARTGNPDAISVLLAHGADVNARESSNGQTALMWAAEEGHPSVVRMLVEHGADVNAHSHFHLVPLIAVSGPFGRANASASGNVVPDGPEAKSWEAIQAANSPDEKLALLLGFEQQFPKSKLLPGVYEDMLRIYEQRNDLRSIGTVLEGIRAREKQLARRPAGGMTSLMFAAREDRLEAVRFLVESGADLNSTMADGTTALLVAILNGHFELANFLLSRGADPNLADKDGKAPLYAAVEMRDWWPTDTPEPVVNNEVALTLIKTLLDRGADPNVRLTGKPPFRGGANRTWLNEVGATPFYRAAASDDITVLRLLLAHGADPSITASDNSTPLMVASGVGFIPGSAFTWPESDGLETLRLCIELNDVHAANAAGVTALHGAAFRGWNAAVLFLVNHGAKLDAKDKQGRTPLQWADGLYRGGGIAPVVQFETVSLLKQLSK